MAFAASLTREQLIAWLGRSYEPSLQEISGPQLATHGRGHVFLVWDRKPELTTVDGRHPVIAVPAEDRREFFSFVATYVSTYQPFSAFFRVAPVDLVAQLADDARDARNRVLPRHLVGAVIAEARAQVGERVGGPSDLSIQACLATISGSAMAALAAGLNREQLHLVFDSWLKTRHRVTEEPLRLPTDCVREFWDLVALVHDELPLHRLSSEDPARQVVPFLSEVMSSPAEADPETWLSLTEGLPRTRSALHRMRGSREDRVRALDEVAPEILSAEGIDRRVREVIGGYLASRVAGASLRYFQLLQPLESKLPIAPMWFGLFSSFREDGDVLTAGECLGRRLIRHLAKSPNLFDAPNSDVSADELEVLFPESRQGLKFRTEHQGLILVEIFPTITAVFRLPRESRKESDGGTSSVETEDLREASYLLDRLGRVIGRLRHPQQQSLFSDRRPRGRAMPRSRKDEK